MAPPSAPVLVVDDDADIRVVVRETLEAEGFRVVTASNGQEALDQIEVCQPSVVLLDMAMPVVDGRGVVPVPEERGVRIPIVVMTSPPSAKERASQIGAQAYLGKPFDLDQLIAAFGRLRIRHG